MEKEPLFAQERQKEILALLEAEQKVLVPQLCRQFSVSPATIRNDLNDLEARGFLRRTHGGAIPLSRTGLELTSAQKTVRRMAGKTGPLPPARRRWWKTGRPSPSTPAPPPWSWPAACWRAPA